MDNFTTQYPYLTWHFMFVLVPSVYLWIKNWKYYIKFPKTFAYITILSIVWGVLFEIIALRDDVWYFNQEKSLGLNFLDIPIEEWLFFIFVPQEVISFVLFFNRKIKNE